TCAELAQDCRHWCLRGGHRRLRATLHPPRTSLRRVSNYLRTVMEKIASDVQVSTAERNPTGRVSRPVHLCARSNKCPYRLSRFPCPRPPSRACCPSPRRPPPRPPAAPPPARPGPWSVSRSSTRCSLAAIPSTPTRA